MVFPLHASRLRQTRRCRANQAGNTLVEFALVSIAIVPFLFGLVAVGISLGRGVEAAQVTRDVGHMYGLGTDFSTSPAQAMVAKLAEDFDLSPTSGTAVLILSRIQTVFPAECAAVSATCVNANLPVFSQRIVLGNSSLRTSAFGTPPSNFVAANGNIAPLDYMQQASLVAAGFETLLPQATGEQAWVVEGFFKQPDLNFLRPGFEGTNNGTYILVIF